MGKKLDKSRRELVVYFFLALMFALLSIPAGRMIKVTYLQSVGSVTLNLRWIFWLSISLSVLCALPLLRAFFYVLHQRGSLPKAVDWFFSDKTRNGIESFLGRLQAKAFSTIGRLAVAGVGILVVVMLLYRTGVIHNDEVDSNFYALAHSLKGMHQQEAKFSNVSVFNFLRPHYGEYFPDCLKLVRDLKDAGAKVVLLQLSPLSTPVDRAEGLRLIRELENTGIVVFGTPYGRNFHYADSAGEIKFTKGTFTLSEHNMEEAIGLYRFKPSGMESDYTDPLSDVTLEIIRKYKGYSDHLSPERGADLIRFGDFTIPVTNDGWMFSRNKGFTVPQTLVYVDNKGDWVYWRQQGSIWNSPELKKAGLAVSTSPLGAMKHLSIEVQGRIVLLNESFGVIKQPGFFTYASAYATAIENILGGKITRKSETGYLWLSVICVAIAGFIAYRFRLIAAFLLMFILAVGTLLFGSYLYDTQNILVDIFYPLLSLAMAMAAFPAIALGRRG
jgi:hypothetical protein